MHAWVRMWAFLIFCVRVDRLLCNTLTFVRVMYMFKLTIVKHTYTHTRTHKHTHTHTHTHIHTHLHTHSHIPAHTHTYTHTHTLTHTYTHIKNIHTQSHARIYSLYNT